MAKRRVESPDGREWTVEVDRVRLPTFYRERHDPNRGDGIDILITLLRLPVLVPLAFIRPLVSSTRWVVAYSTWPHELKMIWKTRNREAEAVAAHVASKLAQGYEGLTAPGSEFVYMTKPAGLDDLDA